MLEISLRSVSRDMPVPRQPGQGQAATPWLMDTMENRRLLIRQRDEANRVHGKGAFYIAERPLGAAKRTH